MMADCRHHWPYHTPGCGCRDCDDDNVVGECTTCGERHARSPYWHAGMVDRRSVKIWSIHRWTSAQDTDEARHRGYLRGAGRRIA